MTAEPLKQQRDELRVELRRSVRTRHNPSTIKTRNVVRCLEASFRASFISVSGISTVVFIWLHVSKDLFGHQVYRWNQSAFSAKLWYVRYIMGARGSGEPDIGANHVGFRLVRDLAKEKT